MEKVGDRYIVKPGDTLWSISEQEYGTGYEWIEIIKANPDIVDPGYLAVGQILVIPDTNKILPEAASTTAENTVTDLSEGIQNPTLPTTSSNYTVQRGDCLWHIAEAVYGNPYRWTDIAQANNLSNPNLIHAGNSLTLPS